VAAVHGEGELEITSLSAIYILHLIRRTVSEAKPQLISYIQVTVPWMNLSLTTFIIRSSFLKLCHEILELNCNGSTRRGGLKI
jgi:hypothetical protein